MNKRYHIVIDIDKCMSKKMQKSLAKQILREFNSKLDVDGLKCSITKERIKDEKPRLL